MELQRAEEDAVFLPGSGMPEVAVEVECELPQGGACVGWLKPGFGGDVCRPLGDDLQLLGVHGRAGGGAALVEGSGFHGDDAVWMLGCIQAPDEVGICRDAEIFAEAAELSQQLGAAVEGLVTIGYTNPDLAEIRGPGGQRGAICCDDACGGDGVVCLAAEDGGAAGRDGICDDFIICIDVDADCAGGESQALVHGVVDAGVGL